jgi:hypothetical protein
LGEFSKNPEMLMHLEGNIALYREINHILKRLGYNNFKYIDVLKPSRLYLLILISVDLGLMGLHNFLFLASNVMKEVLLSLVNFLAYFEAEENNKEEIEAEIQSLKLKTLQLEKQLIEEERYLDKCKQV